MPRTGRAGAAPVMPWQRLAGVACRWRASVVWMAWRAATLKRNPASAMSTSRPFDPHRLDVAAFALAEGRLDGEWPLQRMPRLLQDTLPLAADSPAQTVSWSARGAGKAVAGDEARIELKLRAHTALQLTCQRCLQPMTVALDLQPRLRFVQGEARAEALDEDSDEDVLALTPALDLLPLIEDELILALPLVPRHERCPQPLPMSAGEDSLAAADASEHAFAALASLRGDGRRKPS
jgi:uncharacterized protein